MHLRPCRPKPNTRPTQGGTGADAPVLRKKNKKNEEINKTKPYLKENHTQKFSKGNFAFHIIS